MPRHVFVPETRILSSEVNENFDGAYDGSFDTVGNSLATHRVESHADIVVSGLTIPTSANLTAITASGVAVVSGVRITANATTKTYTASKDTYVDFKTDGTFAYVEVANGASSGMTLTSQAVRIAKVTTSATAVTTVNQYSTFNGWVGFDPIGNPIYPVNPSPRIVSLKMRTSTVTIGSTASVVAWNGMNNITAYLKAGATYRISASESNIAPNAINYIAVISLWDGSSAGNGNNYGNFHWAWPAGLTANWDMSFDAEWFYTPSVTGYKTLYFGYRSIGAATTLNIRADGRYYIEQA